MQKVKHWIFALSIISIGLAASTGFATWKITSNNKNSVDFTINADGDVTEKRSSFIQLDTTKGFKNSGIELPTRCKKGFYGNRIDAPESWSGVSGSLGYQIVSVGYVKVFLKAGYPHGNRVFTLKSNLSVASNHYCDVMDTVPEITIDNSVIAVTDSNFTKTPSGDKKSYDFDGRVDRSTYTSKTSRDICITYKIDISKSTPAEISSYASNCGKLTYTFSASFVDSDVKSEAMK